MSTLAEAYRIYDLRIKKLASTKKFADGWSESFRAVVQDILEQPIAEHDKMLIEDALDEIHVSDRMLRMSFLEVLKEVQKYVKENQ